MAYKIFLCYRRANKELARNVQERLSAEFGADSVFMDIDSVGGGHDWQERVLEVLADKPVVVTLVTTVWNSRRGGRPRLLDEGDHVRFELQKALEQELAVVPVRYDRANWPKEEHLPPELRALLRFQNVWLSQDRWDYDINELIKALNDVMGEPAQREPPPSPPAQAPQLQIGMPTPPQLYTRSMFQETGAQRKARLEAFEEQWQKDKARREKARAREPAFFARWGFWFAAIATFALGLFAFMGGELLATGASQLMSQYVPWFAGAVLPEPSQAAAAFLLIFWAAIRTALSAAAYSYDPDEGSAVFFTRGIFGGYRLFWEDLEPIGLWAAWPIATVAAWFLARIAAWASNIVWDWSYDVVFWIVLGLYTLPVSLLYSLVAAEETTELFE